MEENIYKKTIDKLEEFIDAYLEKMHEKYKENTAVQEKLEHIARVKVLTEKLCPDDRLAKVAAKYHDIGRFPQMELLGSFNDGRVLHHYLGEDFIARALYQGILEPSEELETIRLAVSYHARMNFMPYRAQVPEKTINIVDAVGRADNIENGCIGAVGYVEREALTDAKGYKKENPSADQTKVSTEVWEFYQKGEKFDKMKFCKTYADYTLFAAILAITSLKGKDRALAKHALKLPCKGSNIEGQERKQYASALEGYKDIFSRLIEPEKAMKAYKILEGFYMDKQEDIGENNGVEIR